MNMRGGSQVANPHNAFCIEQRTAAKPKEAQVRVFGLFLPLSRLSPAGAQPLGRLHVNLSQPDLVEDLVQRVVSC